jgi:hypothetical protein
MSMGNFPYSDSSTICYSNDVPVMINMQKLRWLGMKLLPLALGAAGGYAYWYFIGCSTGSCPLTSNWHTSTLYGLLVGATFLLPSSKRGKVGDVSKNDTTSISE